MFTAESDLRLVGQTSIDNWVQGRLEVFFEGSWSQVCGFAFGGSDANVACRQLGFGAGTVLSEFAREAAAPPRDPLVFPQVAITKPGCNGTESRLIDCPVDPTPSGFITPTNNRNCFSSTGPGLYIGCVAEPIQGMPYSQSDHVAISVTRRKLQTPGTAEENKMQETPTIDRQPTHLIMIKSVFWDQT